ncbi:uncharacterized protein EV422DRAFT_568536 [Fimicolochytrium jonesii]|uniref:uncharacterized protein n=1 Tax=Fimicolochytrium jonesii TaxID=1396493 RepID=UPI0022FE1046|nr:uncharacterized protein EV422DRAFT_568536 [Fimicolochytrium jonesii]KAI8819565.1 hypothetical protein EV422DRAFT_568536 [Fimicolochytrium jonesii]
MRRYLKNLNNDFRAEKPAAKQPSKFCASKDVQGAPSAVKLGGTRKKFSSLRATTPKDAPSPAPSADPAPVVASEAEDHENRPVVRAASPVKDAAKESVTEPAASIRQSPDFLDDTPMDFAVVPVFEPGVNGLRLEDRKVASAPPARNNAFAKTTPIDKDLEAWRSAFVPPQQVQSLRGGSGGKSQTGAAISRPSPGPPSFQDARIKQIREKMLRFVDKRAEEIAKISAEDLARRHAEVAAEKAAKLVSAAVPVAPVVSAILVPTSRPVAPSTAVPKPSPIAAPPCQAPPAPRAILKSAQQSSSVVPTRAGSSKACPAVPAARRSGNPPDRATGVQVSYSITSKEMPQPIITANPILLTEIAPVVPSVQETGMVALESIGRLAADVERAQQTKRKVEEALALLLKAQAEHDHAQALVVESQQQVATSLASVRKAKDEQQDLQNRKQAAEKKARHNWVLPGDRPVVPNSVDPYTRYMYPGWYGPSGYQGHPSNFKPNYRPRGTNGRTGGYRSATPRVAPAAP